MCAQTNRVALVQTGPGSIQSCAVLSDDAGNELIMGEHEAFPFFHRSIDGESDAGRRVYAIERFTELVVASF